MCGESGKNTQSIFQERRTDPEKKREIEEAPWYTQTISWLAREKGSSEGLKSFMGNRKEERKEITPVSLHWRYF